MVLLSAPRLIAILPAVWPLPYSFVWVEPAVAHVKCFVELSGFAPTPSVEVEPEHPAYLSDGFGALVVAVLELVFVVAWLDWEAAPLALSVFST